MSLYSHIHTSIQIIKAKSVNIFTPPLNNKIDLSSKIYIRWIKYLLIATVMPCAYGFSLKR